MMNRKNLIGGVAAISMMLVLLGCNEDPAKVEQGRVIGFNKEKRELTMIRDSAMDSQKPVYDMLPPVVFKLPTDPKETGPEPKAGQRMKLDAEKKEIVIYDHITQKIVNVPITVIDLQQPIEKDHPLVYDDSEHKAKQFPVVDKDKKQITVFSGRQKMLCTFSVQEQYFGYPLNTWDAGDEVRLTYKEPGQSLRFMNISKTDIYKK